MGIAEQYVLHSADLAGTQMVQLTDGNVSMNSREIVAYSAGHHDPLFTGLRGQEPEITFTTTEIASLLAVVGQAGADLSGGNTDFYFKQVDDFATRLAVGGANHVRFRCANAFAMWSEITATHQGDATASVRIVPVYDGTNAPVVYAGGQAVVGTAAVGELFTLGPVKINNTTIDGVQSVTISSGIQLMKNGSSGELYPSFVAVQQTAPTITVQGEELTGIWSLGLTGVAISSTTLAYLRKKAASTGNVADGTGSHISFTVNGGTVFPDSAGASGANGNATTGYRIIGHAANSSSDPMTIATNATIT